MQLLLPWGEFFWTHLPGHMLFFIMSPQAVVVSAFYSKIVFVFYVQALSWESPMSAQQVTCFRNWEHTGTWIPILTLCFIDFAFKKIS